MKLNLPRQNNNNPVVRIGILFTLLGVTISAINLYYNTSNSGKLNALLKQGEKKC